MPTKHEKEDDTSSVDSESSSSSSSDDESISDQLSSHDLSELLQSIEFRKRFLSNFLNGQEGCEFAKTLFDHEEQVNSFLLSSLRDQLQTNETKPAAVSSRSNSSTQDHHTNNDQSKLKNITRFISREIQYTTPGLLLLLTHCSLYLSIYGCLNQFLEWLCDKGIIYLFGWHISENAFDCTNHERVFHFSCLIFGCALGRVTGSIWAWNDNESYQRRLKREMKGRRRNSWDARLVRWFEGKGEHKKSKWGPRLKLFIDSFSFFVAYIAVDRLLFRDFANYALDTRAAILEGMPSRQLKVGSAGGAGQCTNPDLSNSASLQQCNTNAIGAPKEEFISDIMNWLENRNRCRWVENESDDEDGEDEGTKVRPWKQHDEEWKQHINEKDEEYLMENVSYKTYYELVGDPTTQFVDPRRENVFFVVLTLGGFGVLLGMGAPFLLI